MSNGIESDNQKKTDLENANEILNIDSEVNEQKKTDEEQITVQSEDKEQDNNESENKEKFNFSEFFSFLYNNIYTLGSQTQSYIKRAARFLGRELSIPFLKLAVLFRAFILIMDRVYFNSLRLFAKEWSLFRSDVRSAQKGIFNSFKRSPLSVFPLLKSYIKKSFERHPALFKRIANFMVPVASAIILIITVSHFSSVTLALNVKCNGQSLGYISDESVYTSAQELVKDKMDSTKSTSKTADLEKPKYTLAVVEPNQLSDAQTISDRLIQNSDSDITPACGVYINGEFICAIKNEMDATQVFNSILDTNKSGTSSDVVSFVQDVEYKQGLYPNNSSTVWSTDQLKSKLNTKKASAVYYTIKQGDTVSGIAQEYGLKTSQLLAMNPGMTENIKYNDQIVVSNEVNYLQTKVVKTEVTNQAIAYDTVENQNTKLYKGTKKVTRQGSAGTAQVTNLVTYIDGAVVSSQEISRVVTQQPVSQLVDVGSKSTSIKASYGTYSVTTTGGGWVWPAIGLSQISSPYGYRWGGSDFHPGMDISGASATGHIVVAAASGTVIFAGYDSGGYGNKVTINVGNGVTTTYGHMQNGSIGVSVGETVSAGQALGRVGSTGFSTGPHLHFEVRVNGSTVNPIGYLR